jgi:hypothetical protein
MPTPTAPKSQHLPAAERRLIAALGAGAAAFALLEILLGVFIGPFWSTYRAEMLPLIPFRPWLLVGMAALLAGRGWKLRLAAYAAALLAAGFSESLYLMRLGNPDPWPEMLRVLGGSGLVLFVADPLLRLARLRRGNRARAATGVVLAALLFVPGVLKPYQAVVASAGVEKEAVRKPELILMTALPIVWGEGDLFSLNVRPAGVYTALQEEFTVRPIDTLDRESLGKSKLLLLAQPRWLAPGELVAVDEWVRGGGYALMLADPQLEWHSELPLSDVRRPPPTSLLNPLLNHWGLALEEGISSGRDTFGRNRVIAMHKAGRLTKTATSCRVLRSYYARCAIGRGQAAVLADADLMRDELWMAQGPEGAGRGRLADNPLILADLLDGLAGVERERVRAPVIWRQPGERRLPSLLPVPLLLLMFVLSASALLLRRRRAR